MENQLFQLKMTAKQLSREAQKSEKAAKANQEKCKKAMEKSNMDGARIYAESAIREKNQALNYLRLSNRIDAVAQRVNTAIKLNTLTKSMSGVVKGMDSALQSMNVEKISQVMDKFEKQFEDLDVASKVMESSMSTSTAQTMPVGQVDELMKQVADEHGLEFESQLDSVGVGKKKWSMAKFKNEHRQKWSRSVPDQPDHLQPRLHPHRRPQQRRRRPAVPMPISMENTRRVVPVTMEVPVVGVAVAAVVVGAVRRFPLRPTAAKNLWPFQWPWLPIRNPNRRFPNRCRRTRKNGLSRQGSKRCRAEQS